MKGFVDILQISTDYNDCGYVDVNVSFTIHYEDGQTITTEIVFGKYDYKYEDILTAIGMYFKGELQFK